SCCEVDLEALWDFHEQKAADLSLVLTEVADPTRYGKVRVRHDGRVLQFGEKPTENASGWVNAGIYLLRRSLIEEIPGGQPVSLERDLLPAWLSRGAQVYGFRCAGKFIDIGTPSSYAEAEA